MCRYAVWLHKYKGIEGGKVSKFLTPVFSTARAAGLSLLERGDCPQTNNTLKAMKMLNPAKVKPTTALSWTDLMAIVAQATDSQLDQSCKVAMLVIYQACTRVSECLPRYQAEVANPGPTTLTWDKVQWVTEEDSNRIRGVVLTLGASKTSQTEATTRGIKCMCPETCAVHLLAKLLIQFPPARRSQPVFMRTPTKGTSHYI